MWHYRDLSFFIHIYSFQSNIFFFFNDTATTEIYTRSIVGSVRCVQETATKEMADQNKKLNEEIKQLSEQGIKAVEQYNKSYKLYSQNFSKATRMTMNINLPHCKRILSEYLEKLESDVDVLRKQFKTEKSASKFIKDFLALKMNYHRTKFIFCLLYTSPSPRDLSTSRMPSSA
eukprot:TRINITY_DN17202_c0_g1_i2.p1 TRINITY_DN17202_c0_g1~~TRINITY_DN17202_c0_g1_i2.p1  ORF type:complete len:174 (+),score=42.36 TRINITY_DN17202_c0_g1_i2:44-565(+)